MTDRRTKGPWWDRMILKHGSEEAVREFMKANQAKSRETYKGTGGFGSDPKFAKEMSAKALEKRWGATNRGDNTRGASEQE